jgi:threonine synthase
MTTSVRPIPNSRSVPSPLVCSNCGTEFSAAATAICDNCIGPLEPKYIAERQLPNREDIAKRTASIWRYKEWLPLEGSPTDSLEVGFTPLFETPALADALGVGRVWIKNDSVSFPTLSFKDRVVAVALNAAKALGIQTLGCASTGNLANAVAAQSARAGLPAWIFIPEDLERGKVVGTSIYGSNLVRVRGHYDHVNRLCAQVADRFGWGVVNVNLRSYYGEGSKTLAFEITEQLGWRFPDAVVAPMAGGSLVTKLHKGFGEFGDAGLVEGKAPKLFGAQAAGCAPIVNLVETNGTRVEPVVPNTIARSIAIGNPADGVKASKVIRSSGGWAAAVAEDAIVAGIRLLAETTGVFTETAGGVTVAATRELVHQGKLGSNDEVVLCITGNGLKTLETVETELAPAPLINPKLHEVEALVASNSTNQTKG